MATVKAFASGKMFATSGAQGGSGPPVVFLHGWRRDRTDFADVLAAHRGFSIDLPGFGASPPPPEPWGAGRYAEAVREMLLEIGAESDPVILVGHSFGGRVATCVAAQSPELVRGLLLMGTPLLRRTSPGRPVRALRIAKALWRRGLISEARVEALRDRHGSEDYRAADGVMRDVLVTLVNEEYSEELRAVVCPCAMLWGRRDSAASVDLAHVAADLVDHLVEFCEVDSGHDVHHSHPDEVRRLIAAVAAASKQ